jgi:hypothetical protein
MMIVKEVDEDEEDEKDDDCTVEYQKWNDCVC